MYQLLAASPGALEWIQGVGRSIQSIFGTFGTLGSIVLALIVFLILKKLAGVAKTLLQKGFDKTSLDEKLAKKIGYKSDISNMLSTIAYLVLVIYAAVIALDIAKLPNASRPLEDMLSNLLDYVPNIIGAGILLYILIFVAQIVKQLLANVLEAADLDKRVGSTTGTPVANSLVSAAYGFLVLLFIPAVLDVLQIEAISAPIKSIVSSITGAVPNVLLAGVLIAVGILVGQIAQRVITNLLKGTGVDQAPAKIGLSLPTEGKGSVSGITGLVVFVSIIVTLVSAAINQLNIPILSSLTEGLIGGYYNVLLALIVLGAGIIGSKFAFNALKDSNACLAKIARIAILVITSVVALDRAGISSDLTSYPYLVAITALGVAGGIGGAIAIGFGAREYVANFLNKRS